MEVAPRYKLLTLLKLLTQLWGKSEIVLMLIMWLYTIQFNSISQVYFMKDCMIGLHSCISFKAKMGTEVDTPGRYRLPAHLWS